MNEDREESLTLRKECYVAVVPADELDRLTQRLRQLGLTGDAIDAFCEAESDQDWGELTPERIDGNAVPSAVRQVLGFDQVEVEQKYIDALEAGRPVLRACVAEDDEEMREQVEETLFEHDATFVHYFGTWSYEEVVDDTDHAG